MSILRVDELNQSSLMILRTSIQLRLGAISRSYYLVSTTNNRSHQGRDFCLTTQSPRAVRQPRIFRASMEDTKNLHNGTPASEDGWKYQAPYKEYQQGEGSDFKDVKHEASCHCGRVQYQLNRDVPLDSKFCHCMDCQVQHGAFQSCIELRRCLSRAEH